MPVSKAYAEQALRENSPVVGGHQYRAQEVRVIDDRCTSCAAYDNGAINKDLCNALPPCTKPERIDGSNVVFVEVVPAPGQKGGV